MPIRFEETAWEDYLYWQSNSRQTLKRVNQLIKDIQRSPFDGIGKPEALRHQLSGFWSRRIDEENRLVYTVQDDVLIIVQCRYHY
ncbi:Txe/YoeB family addiction module toxin [Laribacter hongkongensis]|uniref:Txe/YoeB family addiction module toxin n=1 Tax=Laribacter hongkongensis TaxID=168471 RepID=UPI001EFC79E8|nr:Txe/YoeB family addiction module toxin [Laribacter hongkongensis]MCG8990847.1 Txe/YoeB family addiction module toxin [Laribacter hongkongensis]MCG8999759.1 Txe/YoeB family addiction module toxin [Laribacter hongkongensis]MCG9001907.1 Txe/YoeB family addiction module toxin [Laribacter hongkongensis]MCG9003576.1 Txe/YoeB family addiction module toxin [Laribacter hongkongensis]MCG9008219.1 Txe/YoeB family addiction module toxin [Laribacter hongkongensis]